MPLFGLVYHIRCTSTVIVIRFDNYPHPQVFTSMDGLVHFLFDDHVPQNDLVLTFFINK